MPPFVGIHKPQTPTPVKPGLSLIALVSMLSLPVTVQATGTLAGAGTMGALTVLSGGIVTPGNSTGILSAGSTNLNVGSTLGIEINDDTVGTGSGLLQRNRPLITRIPPEFPVSSDRFVHVASSPPSGPAGYAGKFDLP